MLDVFILILMRQHPFIMPLSYLPVSTSVNLPHGLAYHIDIILPQLRRTLRPTVPELTPEELREVRDALPAGQVFGEQVRRVHLTPDFPELNHA